MQRRAGQAAGGSVLTRIHRSGGLALAAWATGVAAVVVLALVGGQTAGGPHAAPVAATGSRPDTPGRMVLAEPASGSVIASRALRISGIVTDGATELQARLWIAGDLEGSARIPVEAASGRFAGQVTLLVPRVTAEARLELADAARPGRTYPAVPLTIESTSLVYLDEPGSRREVSGPLVVVTGTADESVTAVRATLTDPAGDVLAAVAGVPVPAHLGSMFSLALLLPERRAPGLALLDLSVEQRGSRVDGVRQAVQLGPPASGTGAEPRQITTFVGSTLLFSYPRAWHSQRFDYPLVFGPEAEIVPFIGSDPMRDACRADGDASPGPGVPLTCGWPLDRLAEGGILLTWWITGAGPGGEALPPGTPMLVGGLPASLRAERPGSCRSLSATETLVVDVASPAPAARLYRLTICIRGSGAALAAVEREALDVVASVTFLR